jgi:hypothetical protein
MGPQGPQGQTGPSGSSATITVYNSSSSCVLITNSSPSYYLKNGDIYTNSSCSSNNKVMVLQGSGETFWVSPTMLATDGGSSAIRVIKFN